MLFKCIRALAFAFFAVLALTPAMAQPGSPTSNAIHAYQYAMTPEGVNMQTGHFTYSRTDVTMGSLSFVRSYGDSPYPDFIRGLGTYTQFGKVPHAWSHSHMQGVQFTGLNADVPHYRVTADGKSYTFIVVSASANTIAIIPGDLGSQGTLLDWSSIDFKFTDRAGNVYTYARHPAFPVGSNTEIQRPQVLQSIDYANGRRVDYSYNSLGEPTWIGSNDGYALRLNYDGSGNMTSVCGFNLTVTAAANATSCTGGTGTVSYSYTGTNGKLASITDARGGVSQFSYIAEELSCITFPNSSQCKISNEYNGGNPAFPTTFENKADQVSGQVTATGAKWETIFEPEPNPVDQPVQLCMPRLSFGTALDPDGGGYNLMYDRGRLIQADTPAGRSRYQYRMGCYVHTNSIGANTFIIVSDTRPALYTRPDGVKEYFEYNARGNILLRSLWPKTAPNPSPWTPANPDLEACCRPYTSPTLPTDAINYRWTYLADWGVTTLAYRRVGGVIDAPGFVALSCGNPSTDFRLCDKPLTAIDPLGRVTDYTYDPAHGGVLTETLPAGANGVRPQTRYTYAQRYAWVKNSGGSFVQAATPIWVLTQKSICKAGAASGAGCATASDEVRTTYDYGPNSGPNNLLLRGMVDDATGLMLRTCYGYDGQGNRISETKPRAALGSCP